MIRCRRQIWAAWLLFSLAAGVFAAITGYVWLYLHRAENPEFYTLRRILQSLGETAALLVPCLAIASTACVYWVLHRRWNKRPAWFKDPSTEEPPMNTSIRRSFTLVEMLVVMFIVLMMAALGIAFLPRFLDNQMQTRAVDQLTQWLLTAKQRAKRDGVPTGLRILADPTTGMATQLEYIQQPDPYTGGLCVSVNQSNNGQVGFRTVTLQIGGVDFEGAATTTLSDWIVQSGDYLQLNGGGPNYLIRNVSSRSVDIVNTNVTISAPTPNYKIIRQPRRMIGEDILTLPQDMVIDFNQNPSNSNITYSINVPQRQVAGIFTVYEILFAPSGAVIGQGTPSGKVLLWVRNAAPGRSPIDPGSASLISVQIRTGQITAHPISLNGDFYQFTEDGRSSGL